MHPRSLLSLTLAGAILGGAVLDAEPAHAGRRAFIGGLVGGAVGAMVGGAIAASTPRYYYGGPAYIVPPPPPPVYPMPVPYYPPHYPHYPHYPPWLCPPGYLCR